MATAEAPFRPPRFWARGTGILDVLGMAGGISESGGKNLMLVRTAVDGEKTSLETLTIDTNRLIVEGDTSQNLEVRGGDLVFVPRADEVYVTGEVKNPGSLKFEEGMTLSQAITKLAGFTRVAAKRKVRVVRIEADGKKHEYDLNMGRIESGKDPDFRLKARDLIVVPESIL